jgi:hypothetical protein
VEIVLPILAYIGIFGGLLWAASRKSASAPIEPNPPRSRPARAYTEGDRVLAAVAERHGLKHHIDEVTGRVGDVRFRLAAVPTGTLPEEYSGRGRFVRSLGLDLSVVRRRGLGGRASDVVVSGDFDHEYRVDARHEDQARELLGGELGEALLKGASRGFGVSLDDDALEIAVNARRGVEACTEALSWLVVTSQAVVVARAGLKRPALEQRFLDSFAELAQSYAGKIREDVLSLELESGELTLHVDHVSGKRFQTQLSLSFARPLAVDLRLGLEAERTRFERFRRRDVQTGHARFDEIFLVLGEPEEDVVSLLGEDVRQRLLELHELVDGITVTPTELDVRVDEAVADRETLGELVAKVDAVAQALCPRRAQGAYR